MQKAIDAGIRIITQGNGSSVAAALLDFVQKYNDRNPGKEVVYLNYAAVDPVLTNEKCSYWHFRWDANSDIKMEALTNYMKARQNIKKVYLINQDYSFGQAVRTAARKMLGEKRPDIQIVGDEVHPLLKVTDFAPYIAKIKASGADTRHHRQLGPGLRPAAQGRRRRRPAGRTGTPITPAAPAARPSSSRPALPTASSQIAEGIANIDAQGVAASSRRRSAPRSASSVFYPRAVNEMRMLAQGAAGGEVDSTRRRSRRSSKA